MKLWTRFAVCALLTGLSVMPVGKADDIVDFLQRWQKAQKEYNSRYDRWEGYRRDVNAPPADTTTPTLGAANDADTVRQIETIAKQMQPYVTAVASSVAYTGDETLRNSANAASNAIDKLLIAAGKGSLQEVGRQHEVFDAEWQKVVFQMQRFQAGPRFEQYMETVSENDRRLHQLLHGGQRLGFDRARVDQLARQLDDVMEDVVDKLWKRNNDWQDHSILVQARRAARLADDFSELSGIQSGHSVLVDEFKQFDDAWLRFIDRQRLLGRSDVDLRNEIAAVRRIDRELHQVLLVESPLVSDRESLQAVLFRMDHTAQDLVAELSQTSEQSRFGQRRLIGSLMRFSDEVKSFEQYGAGDDDFERWTRIRIAWQDFERTRSRFPAEVFSEAAKLLYTELASDYRLVNGQFDNIPGWRYQR